MNEKELPFLGCGWSFPPTFARNGTDLETLDGPDNVHKSIRLILKTQIGERVLREDFGSGLRQHLFEPIGDRLLNDISETISSAILNHEPRVRLEQVAVEDEGTIEGRLLIRLHYTILSRNTRFNMVFPFFLNEGSIPS